ncbi:serine hydrolase domain-containing protein [Chachezhania sediminis]|uniref:serine hydrolase domain-containing protein n=1 Tax=Chachezhania sediminis TaxID=2599291 RepID=UPI001E5019C9|nr:serine hydrolase domain-containing protein [Chachezhania sediminis]
MLAARPQDMGFDPDRLTRIADWQDRYVAEGKYPGSSVLITRMGREVYFNATGKRNIEADLPFERDTVARIFSMTKPITSAAVMMLMEKGLFHLDTPVSEFIPGFADCTALVPGATGIEQTEPCRPPTVMELLTHTSGLTYGFNPGLVGKEMNARRISFPARTGVLGEACDRLAELPLAFKPGTAWEYSVAIDVLGRIVEVVSGKTLDLFFAEEIFAPLGMTKTGFTVPEGTGDRFAACYSSLPEGELTLDTSGREGIVMRLEDAPEGSRYHQTTLFSGGGGLVGTIDDYMKFCEMIRTGGMGDGTRLLSPSTVRQMMSNHLQGDIASMGQNSFSETPMTGTGFGLGGSVILDPAVAHLAGSVGDFGWGGLASTVFWVDPVYEMCVVFFTQLMPSSTYPSRPELRALVHGALVE